MLETGSCDKVQNCTLESSFYRLTARDTVDSVVPEYLPTVRNPCFYVQTAGVPHLSDKERQDKCRLTCLPLVYVAGVTKSGTTDFHNKLIQHQHIIGGIDKEAHFWNLNQPNDTARYTLGKYTDLYQLFASVVRNCYLREGTKCEVSKFTPTARNGRVVKQYFNAMRELQKRLDEGLANDTTSRRDSGQSCPLITVDSTPCTIYNANFWHLDSHNHGKRQPEVLTADRIHHLVPNAKAILVLRNPVERTVSDYRFFTGKHTTADKFHTAVKTGIEWWKNCIKKLSEYACAFGNEYSKYKLPNLSSGTHWTSNAANRIRISIYIIYIQRWIEVFPQRNLLIINSEHFRKDPVRHLKRSVYPFLELEPLSSFSEKRLRKILHRGFTHETEWSKDFKPHSQTLEMLNDLYVPYNKKLVELTNDKIFSWL